MKMTRVILVLLASLSLLAAPQAIKGNYILDKTADFLYY
jgi:hypothetical protein